MESVPSLALRSGDLSAYKGTILNGAGSPFPGNQIPLSQISPLSLAALKYLYPLPNTGSPDSLVNNYITNFPTSISSDQGDLRVDQTLTSKQSVFARGTWKYKLSHTAPSGSALTGSNLQPEHDFALTAAHNWIISNAVVNELRGGFSGSNTANSYGLTAAQAAAELGLTAYLPQAPPAGSAVPNFKISGFQSTGSGTSSISEDRHVSGD